MNTKRAKSDVLQDIQNEVNLSGVFDAVSGLMEKYKPLSKTSFEEMHAITPNRF